MRHQPARGVLVSLVALSSFCAIGCKSPKADQRIPRHYVCQRTQEALNIDGILNDEAWQAASWSCDFEDIEGDLRPLPLLRTRMKMLWDDDYLYIGAQLEEDHLQASFVKRDSVIFHDNDFEVFIDTTGDGNNYCELEINALGTEWDLKLDRPYHKGGHADTAWNINGLISAVHLKGTLNDPSDKDEGWTVEIAIPWSELDKHSAHPGAPIDGEHWRINFSRVQWLWKTEQGRYVKRLDENGKKLPEHNWVWSPQGVVSMHRPEHWGYVHFSER